MPAKNRIKEYEAGAYYHLYNRGVAKRPIFADKQDFSVWQSYLRTYLLPKDIKSLESILASDTTSSKEKDTALKLLRMNNFSDTMRLHACCFMPNHFHMLVFQKEPENIDQFMNSLGTRYAMYFNKKYKRVGPLFQGVYKAVRATSEEQLLYLTKYIHRNPSTGRKEDLGAYPYSSYSTYYTGVGKSWIDNQIIREMWNLSPAKYKEFVEESKDEERMYSLLKDIIVDY